MPGMAYEIQHTSYGTKHDFFKDLVVLITTIYHTWLCHVGFQRCELMKFQKITLKQMRQLHVCINAMWLTSLEPDVAQSSVIYPRNQDDEIFKKNHIWSHNSCAEFHRPFAYGQLALAFIFWMFWFQLHKLHNCTLQSEISHHHAYPSEFRKQMFHLVDKESFQSIAIV